MTRAEGAVLLAAAIWGVAFLFQKTAMADVGPFTFLFARAFIAGLVMAPFALRERGTARVGTAAALAGLFFYVAAGFQQSGIVTASVTNTTFLTALYVVVVPFLAWAARRRPPAAKVWIGAFMALAGVWALSGGALTAFGRGEWLCAAGAFFWACYMLVSETGGQSGRPLTFTVLVFATVAALSLPTALTLEVIDPETLRKALPEMLFVGILSSAVTFGLFTWALAHVPGPRAAVLLSSETLFAAAAGMLVLGERLTPLGWLGAAAILGAVLVVQRK